jgi:hypothetical protein
MNICCEPLVAALSFAAMTQRTKLLYRNQNGFDSGVSASQQNARTLIVHAWRLWLAIIVAASVRSRGRGAQRLDDGR